MYEEFFNLSGPPFRLVPDPRYFFGSSSHNKAMAYLHYGLRQAEGFIIITGEIGAGKSMLISHLIDQLDRSSVTAAHLATPNVAPEALLSHILSAFRIEAASQGHAAEIEAFEDFLFDQMNRGRRVLLIIDEAQDLPVKTLEELRILSNMEYQGTPLFQVFLVGQPDFRDAIAGPGMDQLRQRVIASYHLQPLTQSETENYIRHRLAVAGWTDDPSFSDDAFAAIFNASGGVPRKINKICTRILLYCATEERRNVDAAVVEAVVSDLDAESAAPSEAPQAPAPKVVAQKPTPVKPAPSQVLNGGVEEMTSKDTSPPSGSSQPQPQPAPQAELSVFDRLRASRRQVKAVAPEAAAEAPTPATLDDVADAIKAINTGERTRPANDESAAMERYDDDAGASLPPLGADAQGWKLSVIASINDTRDELKRAHHSVTRLRRQLTDIHRRRSGRRERVVASLDRAENLLAELRDAWR